MKMKSIRLEGSRRQTKHGSYSIGLSAVVVAAAVVLNMVVSELPAQYTQFDLSSRQLSVPGAQTEELLDSITKDMTIYYIVQDANRDETVSRLLTRYADASSHLSLVEKDPVRYPQFAAQYTDESLPENSVILVCGDQSRVISYEDMYESEFDYQYYTYNTTGFDAEGQLTSAIAALNSDDLPKLYTLTGHGEAALDENLNDSITKENITTEELNLISADSVPEDADGLLIVSPAKDLSDAEAQKVLNYLKRGGHAVIVTDYRDQEMPNLESVLAYYGMTRTKGVVIENNSNYFVQLPYYLLPEINVSEVSDGLSGGDGYVLLAAAQGLQKSDDLRDGLTVTELLSTSDGAYSKVDVQNMTTYQKEDGDIDGPFALGMIASEDVELTDELLAQTAGVETEESLGTALDGLQITEDANRSEPETADADDVAVDADGAVTDTAETATDADGAAADADDTATGADDTSADSEAATDADSEAASGEVQTAETRLAVFTSSSLLDPGADQMVSGGNYRLLMNTFSWLCGSEKSVSIPSKSLEMDYLTVPSASASFWSIIIIGVIPAAFLFTGLYVWLKRRRQ